MNGAELERLVTQGESERLEVKKSTGQRTASMKSICAMLNGLGGFVLFGVTDHGEIVGQMVTEKTLRDIDHELTKIEPPAFPDIETVALHDNRTVIALRVPGGGGPYTYDGRAYVRFGATTHVMQQAVYEQRLLERMHASKRWENQPAHGLNMGDLDRSEVIRTIDEAIRRQRLEDPGTRDASELLTRLGLVEDGQLLNAAVVLFAKRDRLLPYYPQCMLRMARFRGKDKSEFIDNRQEQGNAFQLFQVAQRFLRDYLPVAGRVLPNVFERVDDPLFPTAALREAIANALCHRDYSIPGGAISIGIYDDRLEISNTGSLPFDITPEMLLQPHHSRPWNPLIAQAFYRRGIIESWGRGTLKIRELLAAAELPMPEFESGHGEVTVRFRAAVAAQLARSRTEQVSEQVTEQVAMRILEYCSHPRRATEIQELVSLRRRETFRANYLRPLVDGGWLAMTVPDKPRSRNQKYIRTDSGVEWLKKQGGERA